MLMRMRCVHRIVQQGTVPTSAEVFFADSTMREKTSWQELRCYWNPKRKLAMTVCFFWKLVSIWAKMLHIVLYLNAFSNIVSYSYAIVNAP